MHLSYGFQQRSREVRGETERFETLAYLRVEAVASLESSTRLATHLQSDLKSAG
jgi:hypothetical protein